MIPGIIIDLCTHKSEAYDEVCTFAKNGYEERYKVKLEQFPDEFVYATTSGEIAGCFGASWGSLHSPLTTEWYVPKTALHSFFGTSPEEVDRTTLAEIGTRVVKLPEGARTNSVRLSVAMSAALLLHLSGAGGRFSIFTADRSVQIIAKQLNAKLAKFSSPDLSQRDSAYLRHWQAYFDVPRECFGVDLKQAAQGCISMCGELVQAGFKFSPTLYTPHNDKFAVAV